MKKYITSILLMCLLCFASNAQIDKKNDPSKWTPEDVINRESMGSVSFSPNNNMVVWTKRKPVKDKDRFISDIYLTRLDLKKDDAFRTIQLTNGDDSDSSPIFSKDGEHIYFLSSRDKGNKLWRLSIYGGEAKKVKEFKNGISNLQWQNENTLLFQSHDGKTLYEQELEKKKDNVIVVEDSLNWRPNHVYTFNIKNKSTKRLTNNEKPLSGYQVSKDGKWLFYSMQRSRSYAADAQQDPFHYLKNLETGKVTKIKHNLGQPMGRIQFTADNEGFYFTSTYSSDPEWNGAGVSELYYYTLATHTYKKVDLKWDLGIGRGYNVVGNDAIVTLANKAYIRLAYYKKNANSWSKSNIDLGKKNDHTSIITISDDGTKVIYTYSTASRLPTFHVADLNGNKFSNEQELVKLNKNLSKKALAKSEVMIWKGYNNEEVTGILIYPENYQEGKRYPLMLSIHGGPAGADLDLFSDRWSTYPHLLSQKGMFVLKPNYHGSSNHGLEFVESIKGNYYEPEMIDITNAIDVLVDKGMVDREQLGTMGWSAGAILTTMLTVRYPDMFKVAAPGAGDVNWTSDYGTCRFGVSFDEGYFGGAPWDDTNGKSYNENYILKSPLFEIEKIKTPTIIFHGSEDRAVPRDQGWEYFRGLQQAGDTPVRFLWFPGQPHGLGKITHQLRKMNEELKWIDTYLFNKPSTENKAFKEGSPLAELFKIEKAKSVDGLFGEVKNGVLIPETLLIKKDSTSIGRFEVTNAQFKAFKPSFNYEAGIDNYPAEVSMQDAKDYVKWLSDKTGETYRLPNTKEAESLHKQAHKIGAKELTLNYWAGYDITKAEVPMLKEKLKELNTILYKKVGKKKPTKVGNAEIYDLGGNIAEYYDNGVYGYSAYDFYDANDDSMIKSKHVGIRVIKE
ncbi:prolyl oligopeptidase family serine peptidase [Flavobacteriaceae bacterium S0825]|uniref:S9 family peptidase n=1 Tax=Gaetbulibacter sp. S0825 TaxID=2720084 RepID=UPI00142FA082|nr:prolyl oligopeptidase family serine peptidase [Gaetbulibacter sp. S0825]MCK0108957.1 prolyl oligopeptidase family serine peptidase [Flavobacteriaceae bacterium S0825]NIX64592.1 prolyl oligopeptidase family serine peptidase [Gaetbulibacter sp. S0825]